MKILIKVDTNDADYLYTFRDISMEDIEVVKKVAKAIAEFEPYETGGEFSRTCHHNYPRGEALRENMGEKGIEELYVKTGKLTIDDLETFDKYVPYSEFGLHTIESIFLISAKDVNDLLEPETTDKSSNIRRVVKAALENMYLFGGMSKPNPKYDEYLEKMINLIMIEINN